MEGRMLNETLQTQKDLKTSVERHLEIANMIRQNGPSNHSRYGSHEVATAGENIKIMYSCGSHSKRCFGTLAPCYLPLVPYCNILFT